MIKIKIIALVMLGLIAFQSQANEEKQQKVNHSAIPPVISPDDPDMQKTTQDHIRILNAQKADHITKGMQVNGKPLTKQDKGKNSPREI